MKGYLPFDDIAVDRKLYDFVNQDALPDTGLNAETFWQGFAALIRDLAPRNAALLKKRDQLQAQIDAWHLAHPGADFDFQSYKRFLIDIGYLVPEGPPFRSQPGMSIRKSRRSPVRSWLCRSAMHAMR